ncbi:MAG: formyltetrahydrofolate deformylase [Bdellovibrionia bacterium]
MKNYVLRICCGDQKGLLHKITGAIYRRDLNVTENGEFVDHQNGMFFVRTAFTGDVDLYEIENELRESLPNIHLLDLHEQTPRRLLVFATKEPHCLGDLLLRHASGELPARILGVVANHPDLKELTERFKIPFHHVPAEDFTRERHEAEILKVVRSYNPDYLVLAKYMRVLTKAFVERFENRILNIHHSFLPAFIGRNPYQQAYDRGVKIIGATAHLVNDQLDEGPIITQSVLPVSHTQSALELARSGRDVERVVLARALQLILEDRVVVHGKRTIVFG